MIPTVLVVFGLALGSFVNALVWRLHEQGEATQSAKPGKRKGRQLAAKDLSILKGRSMCTVCHHELKAVDLIPVASWVLLRGKCRYCSAPISVQYPVVELLTAALFVLSYLLWPNAFSTAGVFDFCIWLALLTAFIALAVYDLRWFLLPDKIVFPAIGLALLKLLVDAVLFNGGLHVIYMAALGIALTAGLFYVIYIVSRGRWIGFGDVKLAIVLGLLAAGPANGLLLVFMAALFGTLAAVPLLIRGQVNARSQIPFGPFLMSSTFIVVLFGSRIVTWYANMLHLQ